MREVEAACNSRDNASNSRGLDEFRLQRCRIHGGYQLSKGELYSEASMNVNQKTRLRVDAVDRAAVGKAFRSARLETGLTQTELAQALGSNQKTLSRWEHGADGAPIAAIRALGKMVSPATRAELFTVAGIVDDTEGLLQPRAETSRIPLINPSQLGAPDPIVESYLSLPSQWLPADANIKAAKFANRISPLFGDELIALVDIRYRDPDRLLNCIVVARTPHGNDAMRLTNDGGTYLLVPIGEAADRSPRVLRSEGDWSILGKIIKWIGDPPAVPRA